MRSWPETGTWAQKVSDELPEVDAVLVSIESASPTFPSRNGLTIFEEMLLVAAV